MRFVRHRFALSTIAVACSVLASSCGSDGDSSPTGGTKGASALKCTPKDEAYSSTHDGVIHAKSSSALVLIVNPSKRAHRLAFTNACRIVGAAARPNMNLLGIYEQVTTDDGPPFDRAFLEERSPPNSAFGGCSSGTPYQKKRCRNEQRERQDAQDVQFLRWRENVQKRIIEIRDTADTRESESGDWNLRGALMTAGQNLRALKGDAQCVVLLGGLAVRPPPARLPLDVLRDVRLIVAGWRGNTAVQDAWIEALKPAGAEIDFLPQAVTELKLVESVGQCLAGNSAGLG